MTDRGYIITKNNPHQSDYDHWVTVFNSTEHPIQYGALQPERGHGTGTLHLQTFLEWPQSRRLASVKRLFPGWDVRVRHGSPKEAFTYCTKDDTRVVDQRFVPLRSRRPPDGRGARTDLDTIGRRIIAGDTMREIATENPGSYIRYNRGYKALQLLFGQEYDSDEPRVIKIYWGEPGTGKTRYAREQHEDIYMVPLQHGQALWFDGYDGQATVIFDEFDGDMKLKHFLRITDRYPLRVQCKGNFTQFNAKTVIFTSNTHWHEWWSWEGREIKKRAIQRRLTECREFIVLE